MENGKAVPTTNAPRESRGALRCCFLAKFVVKCTCNQPGGEVAPPNGGDAMITYSFVFQLAMVVIGVIGLCIARKKK